MRKIVDGYLDCMFWAETDQTNEQGGNPLEDNYSFEDIDAATLKSIETDCDKFLEQALVLVPDLLDKHEEEFIGHDFWLTRNGHGAGFWDGDYDKTMGELLTKLSHEFGEVNPYVGDDGKVYLQ